MNTTNYVLSCCSTVDISKEHLDSLNVRYACFHYFLDGKEYSDDLGQSMPLDKFYEAMTNGADTKTSQINVSEFEEYFESLLKEGKDVLHVSFSSGLSGTYNSARIAANELCEKYPDRRIEVVDSLAASAGYGLLIDMIAEVRDSGATLDETVAWIEKNKLNMHHWFFSSDLTFYVKGGRVSKTAGAIGGMLGICPLLNMDHEGHLIPREKIRPKKKVIKRIAEMMIEHAQNGTAYDGKCYISHSACLEDARAVADLVEAAFPNLNGKVVINNIGTTIGSHTGPGTVALFFWGDIRND